MNVELSKGIKKRRFLDFKYYFVVGGVGAAGVSLFVFIGAAGTAALFAGTMLSVTEAEFTVV